MKELKRALSLAMATVMSMSMMAVGAGAAGYADVDASHNNEAIAVMQAAGVMIGDDLGNFNPDAPVSRQEMAVVMCNLLNLNEEDYLDSCHFVDVDDWAKGFVAACYANGITAGVSETEYNAKGIVTVAEAALMMQKALGYFENEQEFQGSWKDASMNNANKIKLLSNLSSRAADTALTRNDIAQLSLNTLKSDLVEFTGELGFTVSGVQMGFRAEYTPEAADKGKHYNGKDDEKLQLIEQLFNFKLTVEEGNDSMGRVANVWSYGKNTEFYKAVQESSRAEVVTHSGTGYDTVGEILTTAKEYFKLKNGSDIDLANNNEKVADWTLYVNGEQITENMTDVAIKSGDMVDIYETDGVVTNVVVTSFTLAKVKEIDTEVKAADVENGVSAYVSLVDLAGKSVGKGQYNDTEIAAFSYEEGDVIAIAMNGKDESINDSYLLDVVRGQVDSYNAAKDIVTINGEQMTFSGRAEKNVAEFAYSDAEYVAYVDANGLILGIDGVEAAAEAGDVYYMVGAYYTSSIRGENFYAMVVDMEGNSDEIELEKTAYVDTLGKTVAEGNDNKFNAVGGLYEFSDADTAAKNDKNYGGQTANTAAKADNGKFSVKTYTGDSKTLFVSETYDSKLSADLTKDASTLTLNGDKYYLDEDTKYIVLEGEGSSPEVTVMVGGLDFKDLNNEKITVIYEKSGTSKVANTVILTAAEVDMGIVKTEIAYIANMTEIQVGTSKWQADLYCMDGTVLQGVAINRNIDTKEEIGFYEYTVNEDGVYELTPYTKELYNNKSTSDFTYKDETGAINNVMIDSIYRSSKLSLKDIAGTESYKGVFEDVALSDELVVMDIREALGATLSEELYTKTVNTLSKLEDAMEKGTVVADVYFAEGEITLVVVESILSSDADISVEAGLPDTDAATKFELVNGTYVLTTDAANKKGTLTLTVAEGAAIAPAVSGTEATATVETDGNVITVTAIANGTTELTVQVTAADEVTIVEHTIQIKVEGIE